jgi:hypothetical protein
LAEKSLILPSSAELVRAFVKDLGNVLDVSIGGGAEETIPLYLYVAGTSTVTWTPDVDYFVVNLAIDGASSTNMVVSVDNSTYAQNHQVGILKKGAILASFSANVSQTFPQRTRIHAGQKISINNSSATACALVIYMVVA